MVAASRVWATVVVGLTLEPSAVVVPAVLEQLVVWVIAESFDAMTLGQDFQMIAHHELFI